MPTSLAQCQEIRFPNRRQAVYWSYQRPLPYERSRLHCFGRLRSRADRHLLSLPIHGQNVQIYGKDSKGKEITIKHACFREVDRPVTRLRRQMAKTGSIDFTNYKAIRRSRQLLRERRSQLLQSNRYPQSHAVERNPNSGSEMLI